MVFFWKIEVYSPENLTLPIFGPFWSKFAPFWPKINILAYIFQTVRWILLIFCMEAILIDFLGKLTFTVRKNLFLPIFALFWFKFAPFWPKINILAYIYQTVHRILLILGIETYIMVFS